MSELRVPAGTTEVLDVGAHIFHRVRVAEGDFVLLDDLAGVHAQRDPLQHGLLAVARLQPGHFEQRLRHRSRSR